MSVRHGTGNTGTLHLCSARAGGSTKVKALFTQKCVRPLVTFKMLSKGFSFVFHTPRKIESFKTVALKRQKSVKCYATERKRIVYQAK